MTLEQALARSGLIERVGAKAAQIPARSHVLAGRCIVNGRLATDPDEVVPEGPLVLKLLWSETAVIVVRGAA